MKKLCMIIPLVFLLCFTLSCKKPPIRGIIFVSDRGEGEEIYVIDPDGKNERRLTYSGEGRSSHIPEWSPVGKKIAFASNRDSGGKHSIYVMNPDGSDVLRLTPIDARDYMPRWSPDGTKIAFVSSRDGNSEIYVMDADGSNQHNLTQHETLDTYPAWSLDGSKIGFASMRDGDPGFAIFLMNPDGANVERVGAGLGPIWQPDGERIAYVDVIASQKNGKLRVFTMNIDGSNIEPFTSRFFGGARSPDGKQIVFQTIPGKDVLDLGYPLSEELMSKIEIYVANIDGTNERQLTDNDHYDGHCHW